MIKELLSFLVVLVLMEYSCNKKKKKKKAEGTNKPSKPLQSEWIILPLKAVISVIGLNVSDLYL